MKLKLLSLLLIPALLLVFTAQASAYSNNPDLNAKVNYVFQDWDGDGKSWAWTVNNQNVEWKYGCVPDTINGYGCFGGVTRCKNNGLFLGRCLFGYEVIILENYSDELNVIAHEGGHVICRIMYANGSESCADVQARKNYPVYPY